MRSNEGTTQGEPVAMTIYALGITPVIMMMTDLDFIKMILVSQVK